MNRPREPQLIGSRYDGLTEHDSCALAHRMYVVGDRCFLEIGRHRYEQFESDWFWAGYVKERVS